MRTYFDLFLDVPDHILDYINTEIKYEGYIKKEEEFVASIKDGKIFEVEIKGSSTL